MANQFENSGQDIDQASGRTVEALGDESGTSSGTSMSSDLGNFGGSASHPQTSAGSASDFSADFAADGRTATSSPGGSFGEAAAPREGFANHPQINDRTNQIEEKSFSGIVAGVSSALSDRFAQFDIKSLAGKATELGGNVGSYVQNFAAELPAKSKELGGKIDKHARANPWLHIGAIGAGALALGFLVGRSFGAKAEPATVTGLLEEDELIAGDLE